MPIIRHTHKNFFTILPHKLVRDENLTLRDVGLLCYMLSMSNDWVFSINGLTAVLPNDGKDAVSSSLNRLEQAGYLRRTRLRNNGKLGDSLWQVSDEPIFRQEQDLPETDFPAQVNPSLSKKQTKRNNKHTKTAKQQFSHVKKDEPRYRWVETGIDEDGLSVGYWVRAEDCDNRR